MQARRTVTASLVVLGALFPTAAASARTVVFGHSVEGRPLVADVLGADSAPRKVLLVGCIHGNECAGRAILTALARQPVPSGVQLWLLASVNPAREGAATGPDAHGRGLTRH